MEASQAVETNPHLSVLCRLAADALKTLRGCRTQLALMHAMAAEIRKNGGDPEDSHRQAIQDIEGDIACMEGKALSLLKDILTVRGDL